MITRLDQRLQVKGLDMGLSLYCVKEYTRARVAKLGQRRQVEGLVS